MSRLLTSDMVDEYKELCEKYNEEPLEMFICGDWLSHYDKLKLKDICNNILKMKKDIDEAVKQTS